MWEVPKEQKLTGWQRLRRWRRGRTGMSNVPVLLSALPENLPVDYLIG